MEILINPTGLGHNRGINFREEKMLSLKNDYLENVEFLNKVLRVEESFDLLTKKLAVGKGEVTLYYIDGFVKDAVMQKLMTSFLGLGELPPSATEFMRVGVPYVETEVTADVDKMIQAVMSGSSLLIGTGFGREAVIIDSRTYPARSTEEPEGDKVMQGARDGFVETLIFNTALIRRRVRNPALTMSYMTIGSDSKTDVVLCYMADRADMGYVELLRKKLLQIKTGALTVGQESLAECLIRKRWYNPFPKIRTTERPDSATAQLLEGSVLIITDNSPQVMVLPSTIFDFMQESNDYYFPPLTGTYIRIVRYIVFFFTLIITPLWLLVMRYPELAPSWLSFVLPENTGKIPIVVQLLLVEFIIDALRLASLNTPNMLNNSLSIVGGLILGDFAVDIGWLIPEVILYMSFVAIANFTQRSYELGYAIKFFRILLVILTAVFGIWGFVGGFILIIILASTTSTVNGKRNYLYPLIPLNIKALATLIFRVKKKDVEIRK